MKYYILKIIFTSGIYFQYYTTDPEIFYGVCQYAVKTSLWNTWVTILEEIDGEINIIYNRNVKEYVNSDLVDNLIKFNWIMREQTENNPTYKYGQIYRRCDTISSYECSLEVMYKMVVERLKREGEQNDL